MLRCLNSVKSIVNEIIIVDTGSEDKTVKIAENFGAKVYYFKWKNNFSEARNESLKYATKDWILIMDADDEFCLEDKEKLKSLLKSNLDNNGVYYFETLNYCGNSIENGNITVNLNPRLFKNNNGFYYEGAVHNQLANSLFKYNGYCYNIRIFHYGYLDENIKSKGKRERNISLLEEEVKKDINNKYALFNLGNEYFALGNMEKALQYYYKAYENFDPKVGYSSVLMARIIIAHYSLGEYHKALSIANIGVEYFPIFTDVYYLKSIIYKALNNPSLQIKMLEKCIQLGDPPSELKFLYGIGSFRALYDLAEVFRELKEYDISYNYYIETIKAKPDFIDPIYGIGHILKEKKVQLEEFKNIIEKFFNEYPKAYAVIANVFYNVGYYKTALDYIIKSEKALLKDENLFILKIKCLIRTGAFNECINLNEINYGNICYFHYSIYKVLSGILNNKYEYSSLMLDKIKSKFKSDHHVKVIQVYEQLINLFTNKPTDILSEDEKEKEYTSIILEILEILIINKKFDEFEKALNLFNFISDKGVLLLLGKLYYKYGYVDLAKKEILRSIKEFEVFDTEGLNILMR